VALSVEARKARARRAAAVRYGRLDDASQARAEFARVKRTETVAQLLDSDPIEPDEATELAARILTAAGVAW
jgi:hypothetical protein